MGWKSVIGKTVGAVGGFMLGGTVGAEMGEKFLGGIGEQMDADRDRRRTERYQHSLWEEQNAYNSPSAQMERYREAGLNPNLVAGNLGSTTAGSVGSPSSSNITNKMDLASAYQDLRQKDAMTQNLYAQTDTTYKNNLINRAKLGMERERLNADLINANNEAHLKGMQFGIMNNQLRMSQNQLKQSELDLLDREYMRPYELQAMRRDLKYKGSGYNLQMRRIGDFIGALSPFVQAGSQAGASHLSWHRSD